MSKVTTTSLIIVLILFSGMKALAIMWEPLFEAKSTDAIVKVEIDRHSVKAQHQNATKIISYRLRYTSSNNNDEKLKAINNYRVNCSTMDVYLTKSDYTGYKNNKAITNGSITEEKQLQGKEYNDMKNVIEDLCK